MGVAKMKPGLTNPAEMRKALYEMEYDRSYTPAARIAHNCRHTAIHLGMSGEDRMTLLAYQLALCCEDLFKQVLDSAMLDISTKPIIMKASDVPPATP
jgi:hypothetical protein